MHTSRVLTMLIALCPALAFADPLALQLKNQVPAGQKPSITITAEAAIAQVRLDLERAEDHRTFTAQHGRLAQGQSVVLPFGDGKPGHAHWSGKLVATLPDGNRVSSQLTFETAVGAGGALRATYSRDHLDLDGQTLDFQLSRPAASAQLTVFDEAGAELGGGSATYHGEPPGTWLRIRWDRQERHATVAKLELRATDTSGSAVLLKLYPWSVRIAHDEVVFPTGQAVVRPSEEPKLDASYQRIIDAVEKARKIEPGIQVRLYIAGHTDTVGSSADNRKLSLARARAIATWFRDRGLPLPVAYAGFGEDAPKVKTADNTDEPANRRADYIVGLEEPQVARGVRAAWYELK